MSKTDVNRIRVITIAICDRLVALAHLEKKCPHTK